MLKILSKSMMEEADKSVIKNGTSEYELILKAGKAVFDSRLYKGRTLIIIGKGNNGGDGLALAHYLALDKKQVTILQVFDIDKPVLLNLLIICMEDRIPIYKYSDNFNFGGYDTFVDAIFGIGYKGELEEPVSSIVKKMNEFDTYTLSIDINSGLNANNGKTSLAVMSDLTLAIGYVKPGHLLNDAKDYIHELSVNNIGIPYNKESYYLYSLDEMEKVFVNRKNNSHKGTYGYTGVMGGSYKYSGSIKLSNLSLIQLSSGAGVSRIIAPTIICDSILPYLLESTLYPISSNDDGGFMYKEDEIESAISGLKSLSFGMGIGSSNDNIEILKYLLKNFKNRLLIDADGLNALSKIDLELINKSEAEIILTPHVKEFSRLIKTDVEDILNDPIKYSIEFTSKYNCVLLLKGTTTIVSKGGKIYLVPSGSVALSKGGSGDILSGIISGIMGYTDALNSALAGAYLFGLCGNRAYDKFGSYAPLPRDIINILKDIMKRY